MVDDLHIPCMFVVFVCLLLGILVLVFKYVHDLVGCPLLNVQNRELEVHNG